MIAVDFRITIAAFDVLGGLGGRSYGTGPIPRRGCAAQSDLAIPVASRSTLELQMPGERLRRICPYSSMRSPRLH